MHDTASAEKFIATYMDELKRSVIVFNERAAIFGKLAFAANDHHKPQLATQALRHAVDCLLGYGWRKDAFADDVLTALEMMIKAGDQDSKHTILDLAGPPCELTRRVAVIHKSFKLGTVHRATTPEARSARAKAADRPRRARG